MRQKALFLVFAFTVVGCLGTDFADSLDGSWRMVLGSVNGEQIPIVEDHPITITFDGDQVSGTASCNGYGATFDLSSHRISFSDLTMTEMACLPEETMRAESMYAQALTRVVAVSIDGGLTLSGDEVELVFERAGPTTDADLTNTVWVLDGLIGGDSVSSAVRGVRASMEFFTDGSMLGDRLSQPHRPLCHRRRRGHGRRPGGK